MRGMSISSARPRKPRAPRQSKGETFVFAVEHGEQGIRCKFCNGWMRVADRWKHVCAGAEPKVDVSDDAREPTPDELERARQVLEESGVPF